MSNKPNWQLLAKYLSGECTDNERVIVKKWLEADKNNANLLNSFDSIWSVKESNLETSDTKAIWARVTEKISPGDSQENQASEVL